MDNIDNVTNIDNIDNVDNVSNTDNTSNTDNIDNTDHTENISADEQEALNIALEEHLHTVAMSLPRITPAPPPPPVDKTQRPEEPEVINKAVVKVGAEFNKKIWTNNYNPEGKAGEVEFYVNGKRGADNIKLSKAEHKVIYAIQNLLQDKSNTKTSKYNQPENPEAYYMGNQPSEPTGLTKKGKNGEEEVIPVNSPVLKITPHEFFAEVTGTENYSGEEIERYYKVLEDLSKKTYNFIFEFRNKENEKVSLLECVNQNLYNVYYTVRNLTGLEAENYKAGKRKRSNKREAIILTMHPIIINNIATEFIVRPRNIDRQIEKALGSGNKVTSAVHIFINIALHYHSLKKPEFYFNRDTLIERLGLEHLKKRKKRLNEQLENCFAGAQGIGLLTGYKETTGRNGQDKYIFSLNSKFLK